MNRLQRFAARVLGIEAGSEIGPLMAAAIQQALFERVRRLPLADYGGIRPPPDETADGMPWETWKNCMREVALDGWAPCRFGNRLWNATTTQFVFGIAWTDYGIWRQSFRVCGYDQPAVILPAVTFLPSGLGIGVFADLNTAARAALYAQPILAGMTETEEDWRSRCDRLYQVWRFNGIAEHHERHAHNGPDGDQLCIWSPLPVFEEPKPKVLT